VLLTKELCRVDGREEEKKKKKKRPLTDLVVVFRAMLKSRLWKRRSFIFMAQVVPSSEPETL